MSSLSEMQDEPPHARGAATNAEVLRASPRLFDNPLLDKLSRVHWSMPLILYTPVMALLAWLSLRSLSPLTVLLAVALGYAIWTLIEYFGHRYLFHAEFPGEWGARIHFLIHGVHHDHPNDPLRLVMPPLLSGPIMLIALLVAWPLFGFPLGYLSLSASYSAMSPTTWCIITCITRRPPRESGVICGRCIWCTISATPRAISVSARLIGMPFSERAPRRQRRAAISLSVAAKREGAEPTGRPSIS